MKSLIETKNLCSSILEHKDAVYASIYHDFVDFLQLVDSSSPSTQTHYTGLDEWSKPIYEHIRGEMYKHGFINGDVDANKQKPLVGFWFSVYSILANIIYSPNLNSEVADHHSSAKERKDALMMELEYVKNTLGI
ncbi:TPA: hypothetical protein I7E95_002498 [Vibrio cholerae]|nr:hypothetical protein [Vibrio cholerae]